MTRRLLTRLAEYKQSQGLLALISLPFFPFSLLITNTARMAKSLWFARVLANGKWSEFNRFRPQNGINSLFYWTQAINFDRFGRDGVSPYVSTGNFHMGNWWFLSLTSSYLYWRLGAMLPLLSMFAWLGTHLLWLQQGGIEETLFFLTILLAFISSYFYGGAFVFLNYNALGWAFMPIGLFGLVTESYWIAAVAWLAASLGSFTVVFIAGWLSLVFAGLNHTLWPLIAMLPAGVKLATHFLFVDNLKNSLLSIASLIGLVSNRGAVKYMRPKRGCLFSISSLYFIGTWSVYSVVLHINENFLMAMLCYAVLGLWVVNAKFARFADPQSFYMAMLSVAMTALILHPSASLFVSFWIAVSPIPTLIGAGSSNGSLLSSKAFAPFHVSPLIERARALFENVPKDSRVLLALDNPEGQYDRIFDGYRAIYELAFYSGNLNKVLVFPDWFAVSENNAPGSPEFWGREPEDVLANLKHWNSEYVLIYQPTQTELDKKWHAAGFSEVANMDWSELVEAHLDNARCWPSDRPIPKWFLLEARTIGCLSE